MERAAERLRELSVGDRIGSGGVHGAGYPFVVEGPEEKADLVVDVDPRHELLAAGDRPADAELEGKKELLEQPALLGKDKPRPDDDCPRGDATGLTLGRFPILYDLGDEARLAGLGFLIEDLGATITVVADRRLPDEDIQAWRWPPPSPAGGCAC